MKILIDNGAGTIVTVQSGAEAASTGHPVSAPSGVSAAASTFSLPDLLAKAASLGATNAGPAPSLTEAASAAAPIAASVGGASPPGSMIVSSAGSPPPHVYGSKRG